MEKYQPQIFMHDVKKIYLVKFIDPTSTCEWSAITDAIKEKPLECVTIGFVAFKDKKNTVISSEYSFDEDGNLTVGNKTVIPNSCITQMKIISHDKKIF
jgi:hypothetical protein